MCAHVAYHPSLPFSKGEGDAQVKCAFSCPVEAGVLDLETGAAAGLGAFNDFYVETRDAGLCAAAGEILVSGVRPAGNLEGLIQFFKGGERRIIEKTFEACDHFCKEGVVVGHNLLGFDLPFLAVRAGALGVSIPSWVVSGERVVDTYKMFNGGRGKFSTGMLSLQETGALWGRTPDTESGANFGEIWRGGTDGQRELLRHYNMLNLIDTLCLAVHSGILGWPDGVSVIPTQKFGWENDERYRFELEDVPDAETLNPFFQWITAPKPGLYEMGPRIIGGWGRTVSDESKSDYPRSAGRLDAGATMIVGFVSSEGEFLNTSDESTVIEKGIMEIERMTRDKGGIYTDDPHLSRNFVCLRLSLHGGILPPWFGNSGIFVDDKIRGLGEDFVRALGSGLGGVDARMPLYCGQDEELFLKVAKRIGAHRANATAWLRGGGI